MSPGMQGKLLRVLQQGELRRVGSERTRKVDVRIVAATQPRSRAHGRGGEVPPDLFFRLNVARICAAAAARPPRRHPADGRALPGQAGAAAAAAAPAPKPLDPAALARLVAYRWPGNVRELENEITRADALSGERITRRRSVAAGRGRAAIRRGRRRRSRQPAAASRASSGWSARCCARRWAAPRNNQTKAAEHPRPVPLRPAEEAEAVQFRVSAAGASTKLRRSANQVDGVDPRSGRESRAGGRRAPCCCTSVEEIPHDRDERRRGGNLHARPMRWALARRGRAAGVQRAVHPGAAPGRDVHVRAGGRRQRATEDGLGDPGQPLARRSRARSTS